MKRKLTMLIIALLCVLVVSHNDKVEALDTSVNDVLFRNARMIESTNTYVYVITDFGKIYSINASGVITNLTSSFPLDVEDEIVSISTKGNKALALTKNGRVFEWTDNSTIIETTDFFTIDQDDRIVNIEIGLKHGILLTEKARVYTWGDNGWNEYYQMPSGPLGIGDRNSNPDYIYDITESFNYIPDDKSITELDEVVQVSAGSYTTAAITKYGKVYMWGIGHLSETGNNKISTVPQNLILEPNDLTRRFYGYVDQITINKYLFNGPIPPVDLVHTDKVVSIHLGSNHSFATSEEGRFIGWGQNFSGELGNGKTRYDYFGYDQIPVPMDALMIERVPLDTTDALQLDAGEYVANIATSGTSTVISTQTGRVFAFGTNFGSEPVQITHLFPLDENEYVNDVAKGSGYTIVITNLGKVFKLIDSVRSVVELTTSAEDLTLFAFNYIAGNEINGKRTTNDIYIDFLANIGGLVQQVSINGELYSDIRYEDNLALLTIDNSTYAIGETITLNLDYIRFKSGEVVYYDNVSTTATLMPDIYKPVITTEFETLYIETGYGTDELLGAVVIDDYDGLIDYTIDNPVNWNNVGTYSVTYTATDSSGNTISKTIIVEVVASDFGKVSNTIGDSITASGFTDNAFELTNFDLPVLTYNGNVVEGTYDSSLSEMVETTDYELGEYKVPYTYNFEGNRVIIGRNIVVMTKGLSEFNNWDEVIANFIGNATLDGNPITNNHSITDKGLHHIKIIFYIYKLEFDFRIMHHLDNIELDDQEYVNNEITIYGGETFDLSVLFYPSDAEIKALEWSIDNSIVAKIDNNGTLTGRKAGTTTVTVTSLDGNFTDTVTVTVLQHVMSVDIEQDDFEIVVFGNTKLNAHVFPSDSTNQGIVWSSSDESIATVDNFGNLTTHDIGNVIITATSLDGEKASSITITVTDVSPEIYLNASKGSIYVGEEYEDSGCIASLNGSIIDCGIYESRIDNTTPGTYNVIYYAHTLSGRNVYAIRKVKVLPEPLNIHIQLNDGVDTIPLYGIWTDAGCTVFGAETEKCERIRGNVDVNKTGTYEVVYMANVNGTQYIYKRYVTVYDPNVSFSETSYHPSIPSIHTSDQQTMDVIVPSKKQRWEVSL